MITTELFYVPSNLVIALVLTAAILGYQVRAIVDEMREYAKWMF